MAVDESPRRLNALVKGLPDDAAVWREDQTGWTRQDEWGAVTIEALETWLPLMLLSSSGVKPRDLPERIRMFEHPGRPQPQAEAKELTTDEGEIRAFFRRMGGG